MRSKNFKKPQTLHKKVKLIVGFIFKDPGALKKAEALVSRKFGPIDMHGRIMDFFHTDYYTDEFGENLKRKFVSLKRLASPEDIYRVKLMTSGMEKKLAISGKRTVNIDPGYLAEGKLVLLTTKDHAHRVYLRKGVYAESTLRFQGRTFLPWETTYPDYRSGDYTDTFNEMRNLYKRELEE